MSGDCQHWLDLLVQANILKTTPRTGWHLRWVPCPEDVAAHSWGTAMVALVLAEMSGDRLDRGRLLAMAILHDLAEAEVSDIPRLAARFFPDGAKNDAEAWALAAMLGNLPIVGAWTALLEDFKREESAEARLVRDADRLEFLLQAWVYRRTTGNERLEQVRRDYADKVFVTAAAQDLATAILARWEAENA